MRHLEHWSRLLGLAMDQLDRATAPGVDPDEARARTEQLRFTIAAVRRQIDGAREHLRLTPGGAP